MKTLHVEADWAGNPFTELGYLDEPVYLATDVERMRRCLLVKLLRERAWSRVFEANTKTAAPDLMHRNRNNAEWFDTVADRIEAMG